MLTREGEREVKGKNEKSNRAEQRRQSLSNLIIFTNINKKYIFIKISGKR